MQLQTGQKHGGIELAALLLAAAALLKSATIPTTGGW